MERPHKITGRKPESEIKRAAMLVLEENGFSHAAIAKALDYNTKSISRALPKIRKESLAHPRKLKLASKCVETILEGFAGKPVSGPDRKLVRDEKGKPVIQYDDRVKASDAKAAAELVYKAAGELKDSEAGAVQTFIQVNMQVFRPDK